jgi:XRE family aerobic/anaerobic benzoate catabolism transcriptional regulator
MPTDVARKTMRAKDQAPAARGAKAAKRPVGGTAEDRVFLAALGERVREARARRGMTRRQLAGDSAVSERFLAHLEAGSGNVSVLKLRQIAEALHLPPADLFIDDTEQSVELTLIRQFLERLPASKLPEVRAKLKRQFGSAETERRKRIALLGLRGAGKSTLGARLAKRLGVPFIELDREIEREAGTNLNEIFLLYGQGGYRRYERRCLENVIRKYDRVVIASGGSIVSEQATFDLLLSACFTVWLKATPEEHMARVVEQGDFRPMAGSDEAMADLKRILDGRELLYSRADATIDTAGQTTQQSFASLRQVTETI